MRTFSTPHIGAVVSGPGASASIAEHVRAAGGSRVLLVGSKSLCEGPAGKEVTNALGELLAATFNEVPQHVPVSAVMAALEVARAEQVDAVVALGGGSSIDCAKAVALGLGAGVAEAVDFDNHRARRSSDGRTLQPEHPGPLIPIFTIGTTLSGAEHTDMAGITDDASRVKHVFRFAELAASVIILDPEIAKYTPPELWASSGVRALDHAVESMLAVRHMPFRDALGVKAIGLLRDNLLRSTLDPDDLEARGACLEAAWMAQYGILSTGAGLSHAIGHQLAARFDFMHGVSSAVMLPIVMEFNAAETREQLDLIADAIRTPEDDGADDAPELVRRLIESLPIPHTISAAGGYREAFPEMAAEIVQDPTFPALPKPVTESDIVALLEAAW
jgi:alcohol dehydrogenase